MLNGTSAQLGYTMPFTLAVLKNTGQIHQIQHGKANNTKHSKTKLSEFRTQLGSVAFYDTQPGNEVGLFYNDPEPT